MEQTGNTAAGPRTADAGSFDFIVVGAGSAGCVLACRLVQAGRSVLLLEAGPADDSRFVHMPATFVRVIGTERTWLYETEPQPAAAGRVMHVPQGRTLGGGSSVNAMVYTRGTPADYDDWRAGGCTGWGWDDVLPAFRRAEANERLSGPLHGTDGPLRVSDARHRHPLSMAFVRAAQEAGVPYNDDFNGARQEGVGFYQSTTFEGRRGSTAATYLAAVRRSPLLKVVTGAHVLRVRLRGGQAEGVDYRCGDGSQHAATARCEVILSAGALASPKLLLLSGIGPGESLQTLGIAPQVQAPEVGANFQDHLEVSVYGRCRTPISLAGQDRGLKALRHGLQYELCRSGLLTSTVVESGGFFDTAGSGRPDVQFHVLPVLAGDVGREPLPGHGISLNPCFLRPRSRGQVRLRSADPMAPILFDGGYLQVPEDVATLVRGVRLARRILRAPSLARLIAHELLPAAEDELSDAQIEAHVRRYAKTVYHPAGTCRMGGDARAVVDTRLRVQGVGRLRVADASVMPRLISANTNAPTIMIAERCAEFALADAA
ncbi:GMC family oxidoreductase [Variovorax terrae]|uniref:GMC family oxidoreductase N-terminal domain-containing protein n=1 Tax=Variovorax terrae TaxID=2923278 RepID=A0A9X2APP8_9BURK|nr:GMC family oxidoreductase N-terminal domain-containing protein [Variovorax terrae]MCJ0766008.1 GMC family oxidoreductase N-terminal domain-containing protein [Variovorax terrae]